jgi:thymidylate synthase ThyX
MSATTRTACKVIADSISPDGIRLTTFQVTLHRFCLAELNTHCVFARNSASSRAIPFRKQLERVMANPAVPVVWASEQKGMQGGDELGPLEASQAEHRWMLARKSAADQAEALAALGVHKSIVNRLIEPFMWHTAVITATAFENFFRQRCSPLAQPELKEAAELMKQCYDASTPEKLSEGMWHLPYWHPEEDEPWLTRDARLEDGGLSYMQVRRRVSVARCARVSYLTQEGKRDPLEDLALYDRLVSADPMHASPLEHVATPATWNQQDVFHNYWDEAGGCFREFRWHLPKIGKFLGWFQHRHEVEALARWQSFS